MFKSEARCHNFVVAPGEAGISYPKPRTFSNAQGAGQAPQYHKEKTHSQ